MKKIKKTLNILTIIIICTIFLTACKQFFADMEEDFAFWGRSMSIISHKLEPDTSILDNEGFPSVSSVVDAVITLKLHNPQNFILEMPHNPDTTGRIVYFPAFGSSQPAAGTDYTLKQTGDELKLTLKHDFLKANERGEKDLSTTINLYQRDTGRKFPSYSFKLKCNTPPPKPEVYIGKKDIGGGVYNYILCIRVLEGTGIQDPVLHTDIKRIHVLKNGVEEKYNLEVSSTPLTKPTDGVFIDNNNSITALDGTQTSLPSWVNGSWTLFYQTDVKTVIAGYSSTTVMFGVKLSDEKLFSPLNEEEVTPLPEGLVINSASDTRPWEKLKKAVKEAADGATIIINGEIKATGDSDNNGEIFIYKNLTIRGKTGKTADILNANSKTPVGSAPATPHRIFHVKVGKKLTLENITLKNGKNNESPPPGNFADSPKGKGGAIYSEGELEIRNVLVTNCEAKDWGGGIYCRMSDSIPNSLAERKFLMENTEVTDCKVLDTDYGSGGGVYINGGNCTMNVNISNSTFKKNEAPKSGAGLVLHGGHGAVTTADSVVLYKVTLKENELTEMAYNHLSGGAGMAFSTYGRDNAITLKNCTITKNKTGSKGGGIRISTSDSNIIAGTLILENCTVKENMAGEGGGVYINHSNLVMNNTVLTSNSATDGGGVYANDGSFTMKGSAQVVLSTGVDTNTKGKNDVYLANGKKITIDGNLTCTEEAARITLASTDYVVGRQVLYGDITLGGAGNENYKKFKVTPQSTQSWSINDQGKLKQ